MEQLDGDITPLFSQKLQEYRKNDIVQFVSFESLKNDPARLAKEVLREVPRQMKNYFVHKNIKPNPK
jgi:copine 4/6/7